MVQLSAERLQLPEEIVKLPEEIVKLPEEIVKLPEEIVQLPEKMLQYPRNGATTYGDWQQPKGLCNCLRKNGATHGKGATLSRKAQLPEKIVLLLLEMVQLYLRK
jgi:hypothetical protein